MGHSIGLIERIELKRFRLDAKRERFFLKLKAKGRREEKAKLKSYLVACKRRK